MSEMGKTVIKRVGSLEVICRELTVAALRQVMESVPPTSAVDALLLEDVPLPDLAIMTNLTDEQISGMRPSELREVLAGCKEANPDFFVMVTRLNRQVTKLHTSTT